MREPGKFQSCCEGEAQTSQRGGIRICRGLLSDFAGTVVNKLFIVCGGGSCSQYGRRKQAQCKETVVKNRH